MAAPRCTIQRFDCPKDSNIINKYGLKADEQVEKEQNFVSIFPWRAQCSRQDRHYVASGPDGTICGWLAGNVSKRYGYTYFYIEEISTRRIKDKLYGGVGTLLHDRLLEDAKAEKMDFIYLSPLNEDVAKIYTKWGYYRPRSDVKQQFYFLKRKPPAKLLDKYIPLSERVLLVRAHSLAMVEPKDDALDKLIEEVRRNFLDYKDLSEELSIALDTIADSEQYEFDEEVKEDEKMTLDDKRDMVTEVLEKAKQRITKKKVAEKAVIAAYRLNRKRRLAALKEKRLAKKSARRTRRNQSRRRSTRRQR